MLLFYAVLLKCVTSILTQTCSPNPINHLTEIVLNLATLAEEHDCRLNNINNKLKKFNESVQENKNQITDINKWRAGWECKDFDSSTTTIAPSSETTTSKVTVTTVTQASTLPSTSFTEKPKNTRTKGFNAVPYRSCKELHDKGYNATKKYVIQPRYIYYIVHCDMDLQGGGWMLIQNRPNAVTSFEKTFNSYRYGWNSPFSKHSIDNGWKGLQMIYDLTFDGKSELLIEMINYDNTYSYIIYDSFGIGNETEKFYLKYISKKYTGDAGDSLSSHKGSPFVASDSIKEATYHCYELYRGGWWWPEDCGDSNLNGLYLYGDLFNSKEKTGMYWSTLTSNAYSLKMSKMWIRRKD